MREPIYIKHIDGYGTPYVFLHGFGFDSYVWEPVVKALGVSHELYLIDMPGFGLTEHMDFETFKQGILQKLPPKFYLIGWSLGGLFAMRFAVEIPEHLHGIMTIGSTPYFIAEEHWPGEEYTLFRGFVKKIQDNPANTLHDFLKLQSQNTHYYVPPMPSMDVLNHGLHILETWDMRPHLHQIKVPMHCLFGRLDMITKSKVMAAMQKDYPQFHYYLFKKSGHTPFLSELDEFVDYLKRHFL